MTEPAKKGWRWYVGLGLLAYSAGALGLAAITPFLWSPGVAAVVATCLVVSGEVGFWVGAALLGEQVVRALKSRVKGMFAAPEPVRDEAKAVEPSGELGLYDTLRLPAPDVGV
jgi:hypothetical protein